MKTSTLAVGGAGIVAVALAAAVYLRPLEDVDPADTEAVETAQPVTQEPATPEPAPEAANTDAPTQTATAEGVATESPVAEDAASESPAAEEVAAESPVTAQALVTDFRFQPDGGLLVSGTAPVDMPLAMIVDGAEVARIDVGADGAFVITHFAGFSDQARMMTLVSDPDGAADEWDRRFVLAANPAPALEVAVVEPTSDPAAVVEDVTPTDVDIAAPTDPIDPEPQGVEVAEDPAVGELETTAPSSPAILAVDSDGVDVIQPAIEADAPPEVMSTVALDTITYDLDGEVILSGRALNDGFVQVYVNNAPVSRLPIAEDGTWRTDLPDVDTGVYTLRIDEVDAEGDVVSRIETPFLREDPDDVVEAMAEDVDDPDFTIATRTVQPGATLWAIAEERYGSGVLFVTVFEANRDRIRDPDLIYPGQVFMLPEEAN